MSGVSGQFGIRIHAGPHYPRSKETRVACRHDYNEFCPSFPEIVRKQRHSIYALADRDADGNPSKTSVEEFERVCREFHFKDHVEKKELGYGDKVTSVFDLEEATAILGDPLRTYFEGLLSDEKITINFNQEVLDIKKLDADGPCMAVKTNKGDYLFDYVVNTTGFKALLPKNLSSLPFKIVYQPCLGLLYKDRYPNKKNHR